MVVKIKHEQDICIGCGACAAITPEHWVMIDTETGEFKAHLVDSKKDSATHIETKEVDDSQFQGNKDAEESCPVNCIHVSKE